MSAQKSSALRRLALGIFAILGGVVLILGIVVAIGWFNRDSLKRYVGTKQNEQLAAENPTGVLATYLALTKECDGLEKTPRNAQEAISLEEPKLTSEEIITWAHRTIPTLLQFDAQTFRTVLPVQKSHFTPTGWCGFMKAINDARVIDLVEARNLSLHFVLNDKLAIVKSGRESGVYSWDLEASSSLVFEGDNAPMPIQGTLHLQIRRVSSKNGSEPIGIERFLIEPKDFAP